MADLREGDPTKPTSSDSDANKLDTISREEFNTSLTKINSSLDELRAMFTTFMKTSPKASCRRIDGGIVIGDALGRRLDGV